MKWKIDKGLLPVKAHFFFFFAALGPLLPQMNVFGKQLGISPGAMGLVTAVLPLLWATAKPVFGYLVDYFTNQRKFIFMLLIALMTGSYCGLWFLPVPQELKHVKFNNTVYLDKYQSTTENDLLQKYNCQSNCANESIDIWMSNTTYINTIFFDGEITNQTCALLHMDYDDVREGQISCRPKENCKLMCSQKNIILSNEPLTAILNNTVPKKVKRDIDNTNGNRVNDTELEYKITEGNSKNVEKEFRSKVMLPHTVAEKSVNETSFYATGTFWWFVVLMCVGTVAFNVANCIGDAVCFDVLGSERGSKYGSQRAWGTVGYGLTALVGGWLVDQYSTGTYKDFTPAFLLALVFTTLDLFSCRALKLPTLSSPEDSGKALRDVLRISRVLLFIVFAVVAGTFDSFIIYYMFWFLEEMAIETGYSAQSKLIEGVVVAAQSFIGELLFFFFSGKIIKRFGYGNTMSFSLFCYGLRMLFISVITNPWHFVFIEAVMQGPTYALCYSCIVGYAAQAAPPRYSATVQGVVAGMDDGVGFAIGSLLGGLLYSSMGGRGSFRVMAATAAVASVSHALLRRYVITDTDEQKPSLPDVPEGEKMLQEHLPNVVYRDTVVPINEDSKMSVDMQSGR